MIIAPGVDQPSVANMIELVRVNSKRRVDITIQDAEGNPIDIDESATPAGDPRGELNLEITDLSGIQIYQEDYYPPSQPIPANRRIKRATTGKYYIDLGTVAAETSTAQTLLCNWHARTTETAEDTYRTQVIDIVTPRTLSLLPTFRMLLDKSIKKVLPSSLCFVGWTDGMLILLLQLGLTRMNAYQPYPTWVTLDAFPIDTFQSILIKSAMVEALTSQFGFAVDTDVDSFSDQGHSFTLNHKGPIGTLLSMLQAQLDNEVPNFKRHFVNSGTVSTEVRFNLAYASILTSAPYGSVFRNIWPSY